MKTTLMWWNIPKFYFLIYANLTRPILISGSIENKTAKKFLDLIREVFNIYFWWYFTNKKHCWEVLDVVLSLKSLQHGLLVCSDSTGEIPCSFHLVSCFEECSCQVWLCEFTFWELHRTFPILTIAGLKLP
jgi:hypothetical protein